VVNIRVIPLDTLLMAIFLNTVAIAKSAYSYIVTIIKSMQVVIYAL